MNTIVPDKRNAPTLVIFWDPVGLILPTVPFPRSQKALCGTIKNLTSRCRLTGGYETVPGEIRGRLLKISYVAYTKKTERDATRPIPFINQKTILFVATFHWVHWNEVRRKLFFPDHFGKTISTYR